MALVGKSGTGKSFRAQLIAEKFGIELLIDDGLLIREQKIVAGKSAKRENGEMAAVKTALFTEKLHAQKVKTEIEKSNAHSIIILGTSNRMIKRIIERLNLPKPRQTIKIEDIATANEIEEALNSRKTKGHHIIPVPAIEVKRDYSNIIIDSIRIFIKKRFLHRRSGKTFEKTIVSPNYSNIGTVNISSSALTQMILHCLKEFNDQFRLTHISISENPKSPKVDLKISVPINIPISGKIHQLQKYIVSSIEQFSSLLIKEVNITIGEINEEATFQNKNSVPNKPSKLKKPLKFS